MSQYYDVKETRTPQQREGELFNALPTYIGHAQSKSQAWGNMLSGISAATINSRKALAQLPVLRKPELKTMQESFPPFGGLNTESPGAVPRLFMSPGALFEPEGNGDDPWRTARALHAAGIRKGHILQNCFAYHMTPGAWMVDAGARKLGCSIIAAGIGQTEQQIDVVRATRQSRHPDHSLSRADRTFQRRGLHCGVRGKDYGVLPKSLRQRAVRSPAGG